MPKSPSYSSVRELNEEKRVPWSLLSRSGIRGNLARVTGILVVGTAMMSLYSSVNVNVTRRGGGGSRYNSHVERSCNICGPHDDLCDKWGAGVLRRSRAYEGSGVQMMSFFEKVFAGEDIVIEVIGGSMSACMDSNPTECYVNLLEERIGVAILPFGGKVTVHNRAVPAVGSSYFSSCYPTSEADLLIMEFGVNDDRSGKVNEDLNALIRSVLLQEDPPAILFFNMFSPLQPWTNGAPAIDTLAQYYDLPVISHRNVVFHQRHLSEDPVEISKWFALGESPTNPGKYTWAGGHHPSKLGHELSADLLTSWFREQLCKAPFEQDVSESLGRMGLNLPRPMPAWSPYERFGLPPTPPKPVQICYSAEPGPKHFPISKVPAESNGWALGRWKTKEFLVAYHVGDSITFDVDITHGEIHIFYWMGAKIGLGRAAIWLDGEEDAKANLFGDYMGSAALGNRPTKHTVHTSRPPGKRRLTVQIIPGTGDPGGLHEFRIAQIITS